MSWWNVASLRIWRTFIRGTFCASMESPLSLRREFLSWSSFASALAFLSDFRLALSPTGCGFSLLPFSRKSCFPETTTKNKAQHHPLDFPCNIFFSILLFFFGKLRRKKLGVPFSIGSENFFLGKNEIGYEKLNRNKRKIILKCTNLMQLTSYSDKKQSISPWDENLEAFRLLQKLKFFSGKGFHVN